jgi:hypothetical protein
MISIYQVWFPMIYHMLCRIDAGGASAPKSHVGTWQKRLRSFFTLPLASTSWNFMKLQYLLHTSRIHTTAIYGDLYLHLLGALDNTYRNIIYIYIIYILIYTFDNKHIVISQHLCLPFALHFNVVAKAAFHLDAWSVTWSESTFTLFYFGTRKLWQKDAKNVPQTSTNTPKAAPLSPNSG